MKIFLTALSAAILLGQVKRFSLGVNGPTVPIADLVVAVVIALALLAALKKYLTSSVSPRDFWRRATLPDRLLIGFQVVLAITFLLSLRLFTFDQVLPGLAYQLRLQAYLSLYWVARYFGSQSINPRAFGRYLVVLVAIVAVAGFIQLAYLPDFSGLVDQGWDPHLGRLTSTFLDPNYVSVFLGIGFALALAYLLFGPKGQRREMFLLALIVLAAMYLAYSRSGWAGSMIMAVLVGWRRSWLTGLLVAGLFIGLLFMPGRFSDRFADVVTTTRINSQGLTTGDDTGRDRIASWKRGVDVVRLAPVLGVGYNNYGLAGQRIGTWDPKFFRGVSGGGSDASLLNTWATTGILGLCFLVAFLSSLIWPRLRLRPEGSEDWFVQYGYGAIMLGLLANSFLVNSLYYPPILMVWIVWSGYLVSSRSLEAARQK